MPSYLDFNEKIDTSSKNYRDYFYSLPEEERQRIFKERQKVGLEAPTNDGVLAEAGEAFSQAITSAAKGVGNTLEKSGLGSGVQNYFEDVLANNQQWNDSGEGGTGTYIARAIGSAAGSTAGTLAAGTVGSLVAPGVGTAAGLTVGFMQTFGDNVDRNREAGYSEDKAYGMAFLESAVDTAIEHAPFGIIGKGTKNTYRAARAAVKGKGALLKSLGKQTSLASKVGKKLVQKVGKDTAENLLLRWGKSAAMDGLGEAGEEGFQYLNSYLNQKLGGDPNAEFSLDELADSIAQGFIGGFFLQAARSTPNLAAEAYRKRQQTKAGVDTATADIPSASAENTPDTSIPEYTMPENSAVSNIVAVSDASAASVPIAESTPVSGENSISRETLTPAETPIATPEVASAPIASVNTPAPVASPVNIPTAETASVETPANDIPEYTMPQAVNDAIVDYQLKKPVVSDTAIDENAGDLNADFDVDSFDNLPESKTETAITPENTLSFTAPEAQLSKNQKAINTIVQKAKEQYGKQIQIDQFDTRTIKDKNVRQTLAAAQRIFRALGMGKVVMVKQVGNDPLFLGVVDTENEQTRERTLLDVKLHSGNNALLFHTAMHELVHNLIANNKEAYPKFKKAVIDKIYNKDYYNELFDNYAMNRGWDLAEIDTDQQATIEEEFICDTVADLMQTEKFWEILTAEDMSFAQKLLEALKDLLAKITSGNQNNIPKTQQIFQKNLNDVISLAQQFVIESKSSKKDISSLIRAKNKTAPTTTAETSVTSEIRKPETAVPEKGTAKENLEVAPTTTAAPSEMSEKSDTTPVAEKPEPTTSDKIRKKPDTAKNADEGVQSDEISGNIGKYFSDVKDALRSLYKKAFSRRHINKDFVNFAKIDDEERAMLSQKSGVDMSGATVHGIDESGIRHIDNRHGENETRTDQEPITEDDIVKIPEIIDGTIPEYVGLNKEGNHTFLYQKKIGNEYFYLEEYRSGRGKLSGVSLWKKINDTEAAPTSTDKSNGKPTPEALRPRATTNTIPQTPKKSSAEDKKTPTVSDKIRKKPEPSDQSNVSDRQTFSDKFRKKEKEITGVNNPNIIIAESTPQGLKSVEKGDTLKETETSKKIITEDKSNDQRTLGGNTGLSSDTNASASHDGVSETTSDRTAGEKGTGGVSGSDVRKSDGTASAGKSSVAAESGLRNSDGNGSTAGGSGEQKTGEVDTRGNRPGVRDVERASSARVRSGESASAVKKLNANNFRITPDTNLVPAGDVSKTQANIEAIKLIKTLDKENRQATAEEKQILAK